MQEPTPSEPGGQALAPDINAPAAMTGLCYLVFSPRSAKAHLAAPATWRLVFSWALWDFVNAAHKAETRRFCCTNCPRVARARREARAWRGISAAGLGLAIGRTPAYGLRVF